MLDEKVLVDRLLEVVKTVTDHKVDVVWDEMWALQKANLPENAAFGDGQILEQLIKLFELLLPILLRILFPDDQQ